MAPRGSSTCQTTEKLHHRAAYSIAIIIANMIFGEHREYCMQLLQIHNPTQAYVKILELLALAEFNHDQRKHRNSKNSK